jgi:hypothetical protein
MLSRIPHRGEVIVTYKGERFRVLGLHNNSRVLLNLEPLGGGEPRVSGICYFERTRTYNALMTIEGDHCVETREAWEVRTTFAQSRR